MGGIFTLKTFELFAEHLKNEEKDAAIKLILELIAEKKPVREIYEKWIIPAIVHSVSSSSFTICCRSLPLWKMC